MANDKPVNATNGVDKTPKKWTLMFYFASDNPLAPGIVSQLKALKDAGFHKQVNVVAQYDPHVKNVPTHVFDINYVNKLRSPDPDRIGFTANDPFIRNLTLDKLWVRDKEGDEIVNKIREFIMSDGSNSGAHTRLPWQDPEAIRDDEAEEAENDNEPDVNDPEADDPPLGFEPKRLPSRMSREQSPAESLASFLTLCANKYPAEHYMLFILGHGLVVANDLFLFDTNVKTGAAISTARNTKDNDAAKTTVLPAEDHLGLKTLAGILKRFKKKLPAGSEFESLMMHSCSMSSVELAYELAGTVNHLLASQSQAFIGTWPYRQILIGIFNDVKRNIDGANIPVQQTLFNIYHYVLYNSLDYQLAGYSFDLCLTDLKSFEDQKADITGAIKTLSKKLTAGLQIPIIREMIITSHWRAQSYWQESYTDFYDFCYCLTRLIAESGFVAESTRKKLLAARVPPVAKVESETGSEPEAKAEAEADSSKFNWAGTLSDESQRRLDELVDACTDVRKLVRRRSRKGPVIRAGFAGSGSQYAHGLSIYFPWTEPANANFLAQYKHYKFAKTGWLAYLVEYFDKTRRKMRSVEIDGHDKFHIGRDEVAQDVLETIAGHMNPRVAGTLEGDPTKGGGGDGMGPGKAGGGDATGKGGGNDGSGDDCDCPVIKNYPVFRRSVPMDVGNGRNFLKRIV